MGLGTGGEIQEEALTSWIVWVVVVALGGKKVNRKFAFTMQNVHFEHTVHVYMDNYMKADIRKHNIRSPHLPLEWM